MCRSASVSLWCRICEQPFVTDRDEDGLPDKSVCSDCEEAAELLTAQAEFVHPEDDPEEECNCYCVGDTADASDCPLHG